MKQAASRPRPPLPSAASGSIRRRSVEVDAELVERLAHRLGDAEIGQRVEQQPADQELERQIVDALAPVGVDAGGGFEPAVDDDVAGGEGDREKPVARARDLRRLADGVGQFRQHRGLELGGGIGAPPAACGAGWSVVTRSSMYASAPPRPPARPSTCATVSDVITRGANCTISHWRRARAGRSRAQARWSEPVARLRSANLRLKRVELGGRRVDLALQGLELLLRGCRLALSFGESPRAASTSPCKRVCSAESAWSWLWMRRRAVALLLEPGVDGLQIARLGARLLLGAGDGELGVADLLGQVRELVLRRRPRRRRRRTAPSRRRPPAFSARRRRRPSFPDFAGPRPGIRAPFRRRVTARSAATGSARPATTGSRRRASQRPPAPPAPGKPVGAILIALIRHDACP